MATLRKGNQVTVALSGTMLMTEVFEISDSVDSLTLYGTHNADATTLTCRVETATSATYADEWAPLGEVTGGPNNTKVSFLQGRVSFVRAKLVSGSGSMSVTLVAR